MDTFNPAEIPHSQLQTNETEPLNLRHVTNK